MVLIGFEKRVFLEVLQFNGRNFVSTGGAPV